MKTSLFAPLVALTLCSGCASIMCSDHKTISIQSDPPGAQFEIEDHHGVIIVKERTPNTVTLDRGSGYFKQAGYLIRFEKEGYEPLRTMVNQGFETGWYWLGNFVFGGFIGWVIVDPLTGAMWTIEDVRVSLTPAAVSETPTGPNQITGYKAHVNPTTGEIETAPVYERAK